MKFKKIILNGLWILVLMLVFAAPPVFAEDCPECTIKIAEIKDGLATAGTISPTDMEEANRLLNLGISLYEQGDNEGAIAALEQAKALLNI